MFFKTFVLALLLQLSYSAVYKDFFDNFNQPQVDDFFRDSLQNVQSNEFGGILPQHHLKKRQANGNGLLRENKAFGACRTPFGEDGQCRHIIYCRIPELQNDIWRIVSQLCVIEKTSIGICCPESSNFQLVSQVFAPNDFKQTNIVKYPETRGCGLSTKQLSNTIVRTSESNEWSWMAALMIPGIPTVFCGGALITERHVLTAAHCLDNPRKNYFFVRVGEYNTEQLNETRARDLSISNIVQHIDYDPMTWENDIALVRVERPVLYNSYIWPVCLPPLNFNWEDSIGTVPGWGTTGFGLPFSEVLLEVSLPIWKHHDCEKRFTERIPETTLCAGFPDGLKDSCQGDSGGSLLVQLPNGRWVTAGIVSWGIGCGKENRPGVYTRVDKYLQWIFDNSHA